MPPPVYSVCVIEALGFTLDVNYTVPAGRRLIVRDADIVFFGVSGSTTASLSNPTADVYCFSHRQTVDDEYYGWRGRQVFDEGLTLSLQSSGPNEVSGRVSGYLLTL